MQMSISKQTTSVYCRGHQISVGVLRECKHSAVVAYIAHYYNASLWDGHISKVPFPWEIWTPSNTWFLWRTWVFIFASEVTTIWHYTNVYIIIIASRSVRLFLNSSQLCPNTLQWATTSPKNCPFPLGDLDPI